MLGTASVHGKYHAPIAVVSQDESGKLRKETDYTLEGSVLVLQKAYLSQLPDGPQPLRLTFSAGNDAFVTVDVHPQP
ncbi:X2-like carbohydrate binding domain-containing protein [Paenibacillus sp. Y412MC10]|uniref:X2-like carbohydrate binding domain-containing protein n=1 Tax=Geobacillus sp. (strain Y412MC10) TaxID=481743 RepID=UPI00119D249B|nr:X2-like carbohydrate binding domain-containing protein [Paenibacillus sp. Y412MC10]